MGINTTDMTSHIIVEWIAANDLVVINQGEKPTFKRDRYTSILDLTIVTKKLTAKH